jgi:hypothetical protein
VKGLGALALAAGLVAANCKQEQRMTPSPTADELHQRLRRDFESRTDRPVTDRPPRQGSDGQWRSPDGPAITYTGVLSWTRPPQNEGVPFTAFYSAEEHRYWVHQGGGLGGTEFWFGPFDLRP